MNISWLTSFTLILLAVALTSGCKKKSEPPAPETPAASQPASSPKPAAAAPAAAVTAPAAPAVPLNDANTQAMLAQMTQQLRQYCFEKKASPRTFEEFAASGYLKQAPAPPPGKKFAIAGRQMEIILVNR